MRPLNFFYNILSPLSPLYGSIMRLRRWMYSSEYFSSCKLPCFVVSVGNLSMGGTGKTPHVTAISKYLQNKGYRPAIITRGYGGRAGKGPLVVSDGNQIFASPHESGDEPAMMAEQLKGTPIVAGSDRFAGGMYAVNNFCTNFIILDDGFQHISVYRNFDIVLMSARAPLWENRVFPGGELREPIDAIQKNASVILVTKSEFLNENERVFFKEKLHSLFPGVLVFFSTNVFAGLTDLNFSHVDLDQLKQSENMVVSAIAEPKSMLDGVKNLGIKVKEHLIFKDHYLYRTDDIKKIGDRARQKGCSKVIISHKDAIKIKHVLKTVEVHDEDISFIVTHIKASPEKGFWELFDRVIK